MRQKQPVFSIIIPTYARPKQLNLCLCSLARLDYSRNQFEVIVVEDGSKMPLDSLAAPFQDSLNITLITQPHAGPATARNTGAARAKGKYLAFIDDDCTVAPDWLQALAARFATKQDIAIGGLVINTLTDNVYSSTSQLLINYLYDYYSSNSKQGFFLTSNNLTIPANHFSAIGGFDTTFPLAAGEDREFCERWLHYGYRLIYVAEAIVCHAHKLAFSTFFRQHFNYGRGAFHFHQICSLRNQSRTRIEPLSFYLKMLHYPFSKVDGPQALLLVMLLIVSQVANTTGFFWEMMKQTIWNIKKKHNG